MLLMASVSSYSQTLSSNTKDECLVPCSTLRNALIMNQDYQLLLIKNKQTSDSLELYMLMNKKNNELISNKNSEISFYKDNENKYKETVKEKDIQINEWKRKYKTQKILKNVGFGLSGLTMIGALILIL